MACIWLTPAVSLIIPRVSVRCWIVLPPSASNRKVLITIKPSPPVVISANMTACPKGAQYSGVLTTVCPVTVMADTEVKKAVSTGVNSPELAAMGNASSPAPTEVSSVNPAMSRKVTLRNSRRGWRGDSFRRMVRETSRRRGSRMMASIGRRPRVAAKLTGSRAGLWHYRLAG